MSIDVLGCVSNTNDQSTPEFQNSSFDQQPSEDDVKIKRENSRTAVKILEIKYPENSQNEEPTGSRDNLLGHERLLGTRVNNPDNSHNDVWREQTSSATSSDAQVIIQNIDQELLFQVANILSASNDASSLIAEWSQAPNKTQTSNLEEQLRHFANHNSQVLHNSGQNTPEKHQQQSNNTPRRPDHS